MFFLKKPQRRGEHRRKKTVRPQLFLLFGLSIFCCLFLVTASLSFAEADSTDSAAKRPPPPRRIPPNKVKPGGGLDATLGSCHHADESLMALVPVENPVFTAKTNPSFLFYIPDPPTAISHGEFSILTADEKQRVYQTEIAIARTPGIIKIDLPAQEEYALQSDRSYHWYFKIYCQDSAATGNYLDVDGWIRRVPMTPEIESQLANSSPEIWYDAIANEAEKIIANPQRNNSKSDRWLKLMEYINQGHLTDNIIPTQIFDNTAEKKLETTTQIK